MILEALERVLDDHCNSAAVRRIEAGDRAGPLWDTIEQGGFLDILQSEELGGAALPLPDLFPILECLGRHCVPLPIAQSIVARALVGAQATLPPGLVTIANRLQHTANGDLFCVRTPYGLLADYVLTHDGEAMLLMPCAGAERTCVGDPRNATATLTWRNVAPVMRFAGDEKDLSAFTAAMAAAMLSGAMQQTFDMALAYCNTRVQFGKSIGKFQALQQQLSVMAEHVLAGAIAAECAFRSKGLAPSALAGAMAKSRTSEAASLVAATAHAVHGAIGMTDEYDLGLLTRRLHDWRMSYGAEDYWNQIIGQQILSGSGTLVDQVRDI
jgi:alkylation response protein AidB-like acyl-CoA dehydrogenase